MDIHKIKNLLKESRLRDTLIYLINLVAYLPERIPFTTTFDFSNIETINLS